MRLLTFVMSLPIPKTQHPEMMRLRKAWNMCLSLRSERTKYGHGIF